MAFPLFPLWSHDGGGQAKSSKASPKAAATIAAPDHARAGEEAQLVCQLGRRERVELLDPHDRDILDAALAQMCRKIIVDLAAAQHDAAHGASVARGTDHRHKRGAESKVLEIGHRMLVPQQRLRGEHDQRAALLSARLSPQEMKEVRRCRAVCDRQIIVGAKLQEPFDPS
jgi:hypothetical protein